MGGPDTCIRVRKDKRAAGSVTTIPRLALRASSCASRTDNELSVPPIVRTMVSNL